MLSPGLIQKQTQSYVMTPQLRQAIEMLQYNQQDLAQYIRLAVEQNPLLSLEEPLEPREEVKETDPPSDVFDESFADDDPDTFVSAPDRPETATDPPDTRVDLAQQIRLTFRDPMEQAIALHLLHQLDTNGRLPLSPARLADELGVSRDLLEKLRYRLLHFDPPGVFATSLEECLSAQLRLRDRLDPAMQILLRNLDLLAAREWRKLRERCRLEQEDLLDMLAEIRTLDPKPGAIADTENIAIEPDIIVRKNGPGYRITLNNRLLPRLSLDTDLQENLGRASAARATMARHASEGAFLLRALENRKNTLLKTATAIVRHQHAFMERGLSAMRPFTLRELARQVEMHESTISRAVNGKMMDTPRGVLSMRLFFPAPLSQTDDNSLSATAIRHQIRHLIENEGDTVLSDDAICARLQDADIPIQRRTVAKYREALGLPNSSRRKRLRRVT